MSSVLEKLEAIKARFDELGIVLTNPEIVGDNKRFTQVSREYHKLEKIVLVYKSFRTCLDSLDFAREVLNTEADEDLRSLAKDDLEQLEVQKETLEEELKQLLIPKDPQDEKLRRSAA